MNILSNFDQISFDSLYCFCHIDARAICFQLRKKKKQNNFIETNIIAPRIKIYMDTIQFIRSRVEMPLKK